MLNNAIMCIVSRMVLLQTNVQVMKEIMTQITTYTRSAIIINVSNPMDILTYIAQKEFNYPRNLLIGTGTLLDTARFNKMLADLCGVDAKNVTGFVLGEHGGAQQQATDQCGRAAGQAGEGLGHGLSRYGWVVP